MRGWLSIRGDIVANLYEHGCFRVLAKFRQIREAYDTVCLLQTDGSRLVVRKRWDKSQLGEICERLLDFWVGQTQIARIGDDADQRRGGPRLLATQIKRFPPFARATPGGAGAR